MKPLQQLYPIICSFSHLKESARRTLNSGRRFRGEGAWFQYHLEQELIQLQAELSSKQYRHGTYRCFTIYEPKQRTVLAAALRDRVVHHALHDAIEPRLDPMFIYDSYACRSSKGTHKALERTQYFLRRFEYIVHLDVKKYFPSIDLQILKNIIKRYIADSDVLWLCENIIDSGVTKSSQQDPLSALPLFAAAVRQKGLPIGNLTSQFFANLYLNELDQYVKHVLKCAGYVRYMDDFVLFGNDRDQLLSRARQVEEFCKRKLLLSLHQKGGVKRHSEGLPFLGFRNCRFKRLLKGPAVDRFYRRNKQRVKMLRRGELDDYSYIAGLRSWERHAKYGNTCQLRLHFSNKYRNLGLGILKSA